MDNIFKEVMKKFFIRAFFEIIKKEGL